jgi:ATP-dependent Clp protease adaptor protein ClpS
MRPERRRLAEFGSGSWYGRGVSPRTLTPPRERISRGTGTGVGKPWRVVVRNDDHNTFQGVAFALSSVLPEVDYERGMTLANRIHNTGQAIVWSGHKELAELYWTQLEGCGLTMAPLEQ